MAFEKKVPEWKAPGSEPGDDLKATGFTAGYKPPAAFFNWFWHSVSECLKELQGITPADIGAAPKSHGRHVEDICTAITDWDNATTNGWYMGNNAANGPTVQDSGSLWYFGHVITHNANYVFQEVYQFTASSDAKYIPKYIRARMNGTWGEWVDVTVQTKVPVNAILNGAKQDLSNVTDETIQARVNDIFSRKIFGPYCVELSPPKDSTNGGFIDFHFGGDYSKDYTARIIEDVLGELRIIAKVKVGGDLYENGVNRVYSTGNKPKASDIGAGTFAGAVYANRNSGNQAPGQYVIRNSKLATAEENPTYEGEICWTYE